MFIKNTLRLPPGKQHCEKWPFSVVFIPNLMAVISAETASDSKGFGVYA